VLATMVGGRFTHVSRDAQTGIREPS
jgi:hypothetical protein